MHHAEQTLAPENRWPVATPILIVLASLAMFLFTVNRSSPWESDQPAKGAQILEIVDSNDYFLSTHLPNYYKLRQLPLYYFLSSLVYKVVGGPIIQFMNLSSVVTGTLTVLAACYAVRNALRVHPFWTAIALLSMPLVVINSTYGNEAAFSLFFLTLAMLLATCRSPWLYYGSGVALSCAIFSRMDMVVLVPYWGLWALIFGPPYENRVAIVRRGLKLGVVLACASLAIWLLLVRQNSLLSPRFADWESRILLIVGYLSYPFNLSAIVLGAIGWLLLCRQQRFYAAVHLLLLLPVAFYIRNLASPKYVIVLTLFYGIPAAYLLARGNRLIRVVGIVAMLAWFLFGVSNFGVFGPQRAALWYLPTMDGPIPIGGYANFYNLARQGFYQAKQDESVAVAKSLLDVIANADPSARLLGDYPGISLPLNRAMRRRAGDDAKIKLPETAKIGDSKFLMVRWGVIGVDRSTVDFTKEVLEYLEKGQLRPLAWTAGEAFPEVVEIGEQVPVGTNVELGKRFLFMHDYYHGYRAFHLPEFVESYAATSWLPIDKVSKIEGLPKPIYQDAHFAAFDQSVPGAELYGLQWPSRYHQFERIRPNY